MLRIVPYLYMHTIQHYYLTNIIPQHFPSPSSLGPIPWFLSFTDLPLIFRRSTPRFFSFFPLSSFPRETYNPSPFQFDLFHLTRLSLSLVSCIFLKMTQFNFPLWLNKKLILYLYHIFFIHSSVDGHLGHFHSLAIVNCASINMA